MDKVVPWTDLLVLIGPCCPASGRRGRPLVAVSTMVQIHFMQQRYAVSDPAMEDALYEIESMRWFAGPELNEGAIPDEASPEVSRFLERPGLAVEIPTPSARI